MLTNEFIKGFRFAVSSYAMNPPRGAYDAKPSFTPRKDDDNEEFKQLLDGMSSNPTEDEPPPFSGPTPTGVQARDNPAGLGLYRPSSSGRRVTVVLG